MSFIFDLVDSVSGNRRAAGQAIAEIGRELSGIEEWIAQSEIDPNNVHLAVGREIIEQDVHIYEKAQKLIIRLEKTISIKWDESLGADLQRAGYDLLVMSYVVAAGEGFHFNEGNAASYPLIAGLASLDNHSLLLHFQEAADNIQELYEKYFPRG